MKVVGFLFVMGPMALPTLPGCLIAVPESCCPGVTDQTVHIRVRCRGILCFINQGKRIGLTIFGAVAVKTKISNLARCPGFIAGYGQVTLQARLIFVCKFRKFGLIIVALAAFFLGRPI